MVARKTAMVAPRLFQRTESSDQAATPVDTTPRPTGRPRKKNVRPLHTLTSISDWERAFSTRKRTLMSKAYELEVATGSVVTITVHAPTGEIHYYANDDVHVEGLKKAKLVSDDSKRYTQHYFSDQVTNRISMIQNLFRLRNLDPEASQTATALPTTSTPQPTRAATVPTLLPTVTDKSSPNRTATSANDGVSQASPHTNGNLNKLPSPAGVSVQSEVSSADQTPETAASVTNPSNTVSPRASSVHPRKNTSSSADGSQNLETKGKRTVSPRAERVCRGEADISPFPSAKRDRFPASVNTICPSPVSTPKSPEINVTVLSPVAQVQSNNTEELIDSDSSESSESTTSSEDSDSSSSEEENNAPFSGSIPLSQLSPVSKAKSYISPFLSPTVARANVVPLPFSPRADSVVDLTEPEHFKAVENMLQLPPDVTRISDGSTEDNPYSFNHLLSPTKTPAVNRSSPLDSDGQCKKKAVMGKKAVNRDTSVDSPLGSKGQCKKKAVKSKKTGSRGTSVDDTMNSDDQSKKKAVKDKKSVKGKNTAGQRTSVGSPLDSDSQCNKKSVKSKKTVSRGTSVDDPLNSDDQCKKKAVKGKKSVKGKNTAGQRTSVGSPLDSDSQCNKKSVKSKKTVSRGTSVDDPLNSDDQCKKKAVKGKKSVKGKNIADQSTSVNSPLDSDSQCNKKSVKSKKTVSRGASVDDLLNSDDQCKKKAVKGKKSVKGINIADQSTSVNSPLDSDSQCQIKSVKRKATVSRGTSVDSPLSSDSQRNKKSVKSKNSGSADTSVKSKLKSSIDPPKAKNVESEAKIVADLPPKTSQTRVTREKRPNSASYETTSPEKLLKRKRKSDSGFSEGPTKRTKRTEEKTRDDDQKRAASLPKSPLPKRDSFAENAKCSTPIKQPFSKTDKERTLYDSSKRLRFNRDRPPSPEVCDDFSAIGEGKSRRSPLLLTPAPGAVRSILSPGRGVGARTFHEHPHKNQLPKHADRPTRRAFHEHRRENELPKHADRPTRHAFHEHRRENEVPNPADRPTRHAFHEHRRENEVPNPADRPTRRDFHEHRRENELPKHADRPTRHAFHEHRRENEVPNPADHPTRHAFHEHRWENEVPDPADHPTREELCKQVRDDFDEKLSEHFLAQDEQLHRYVTKLESMRLPMCPITMLHQMKAFQNLALNIKRHTGNLSRNSFRTFMRNALLQTNVVDVLRNGKIERKLKRSKPIRKSPIPIRSHIKW